MPWLGRERARLLSSAVGHLSGEKTGWRCRSICRCTLPRCAARRTVVHAPRKPRTVAPARPSSTIHPFEPATPFPQPLMRADFTLFDEYEHMHGDKPPFAFPLTTFWGSRDRRIKQHLVKVRL